jgi:hypothetical protein
VAHVNSFQNASGFFTLAQHESGGWEPWHVTGDVCLNYAIASTHPAAHTPGHAGFHVA